MYPSHFNKVGINVSNYSMEEMTSVVISGGGYTLKLFDTLGHKAIELACQNQEPKLII